MRRFGGKLRALRQRRGWSQQQVSELLEVSRPYVAKMERGGGKMPNAHMILKIADIFEVTTDQLMWDELDLDSI
ncbi:helix-turn-helix domain-containing protein [Chloroflexi bacterium TSY]|nr:helix-turn-helix domain-containing protein [Chloroflexi bacterium TSY]